MASAMAALVYRRKLNLKAEMKNHISIFSFKCLVPDGSNWGLIGSTCTALPSARLAACGPSTLQRGRAPGSFRTSARTQIGRAPCPHDSPSG